MDEEPEFRNPAREKAPRPFSALLGEVVRRRGWTRHLEGARIHEHWDEIAGADIARHATPVRLAGGVLLVEASSGAWATQLHYLTGELTARANAVLGPGTVTQVKIITSR